MTASVADSGADPALSSVDKVADTRAQPAPGQIANGQDKTMAATRPPDPPMQQNLLPAAAPPSVMPAPPAAPASHIPGHEVLHAHVAAQIAEVARPVPDRPVEVALNPVELGRVRLSFDTHAGAMHVTITTERPETLDLIRHNIDMLARDLRQSGYRDVGFSFGSGGGATAGGNQPHPDGAPASLQFPSSPPPVETAAAPPPPQLVQAAGLDGRTGMDLRI